MFTKMILSVFLVFALAGCVSSPKKQVVQSQPVAYEKSPKIYQQESYPQNYDYEDAESFGSYEKPAKKVYSEPAIQLSPKQIQRVLKNGGFYQGPIDGKIGPKTKEAIVKFQKSKGLKADGIVGKKPQLS